jgi:DNA repair exonuclease SbcCD nuclease subunit
MNKVLQRKVGSFSDIHIGLNQDNPIWHNSVLEFAKKVSEFYKKNKIKDIIIPGDIFHNRSEISVKTLYTANKFFEYFKEFNILISAGNHDSFFKDRSDVNSICLFDGWSNITIIDSKPLVLKTVDGKNVSLIPWGVTPDNIPQADICFGHFEINTFNMNTFKVCDKGEESKNLLNKSPFVISGHFHHKDHREYSKGQILYMGSPYQQNFGDIDEERGYYIIDTLNNSFEFFENNFSPKYHKVSVKNIKCGKITSAHLKQIVPNNFISFVIDENLQADDVTLLSSKIQNLNPSFFRIDYKDLTNNFTSNNNVEYNTIDVVKNIEDFILSIDNIDHKEEVAKYLTELYNNTIK